MAHIQPNTELPKTPAIRVYAALITQTGTGVPIATILHNTLGTITYARTGVGQYEINNVDQLFTDGKTFITITPGNTGRDHPTVWQNGFQIKLFSYNTAVVGIPTIIDNWTRVNLIINVYK